jgi:hypothetical protein
MRGSTGGVVIERKVESIRRRLVDGQTTFGAQSLLLSLHEGREGIPLAVATLGREEALEELLRVGKEVTGSLLWYILIPKIAVQHGLIDPLVFLNQFIILPAAVLPATAQEERYDSQTAGEQ